MEVVEVNVRTPDPGIQMDSFQGSMNKALELTLEFSGAKSAYDINNGYCNVFADYMLFIFSRPDLLTIRSVKKPAWHTFIEYNGRFYDSECLEGVVNYKKLPIFVAADKFNASLRTSFCRNLLRKLFSHTPDKA